MKCKRCGKEYRRGCGTWRETCSECRQILLKGRWLAYQKYGDIFNSVSRHYCKTCGGEFYAEHSRARYCSEHCRQAARRRQNELKECQECGQSFEPKRADAKYCSVACKQKAYRRRVTDNNAVKFTEPITVTRA